MKDSRQLPSLSTFSHLPFLPDVDSCEIVRETLAKSLYAALFTSLIGTMNDVMASPRHTPLTLGTLDIYGFEILQNNSLEQFLINYVNEKLQALFIDRILRQAQEEYVLNHSFSSHLCPFCVDIVWHILSHFMFE